MVVSESSESGVSERGSSGKLLVVVSVSGYLRVVISDNSCLGVLIILRLLI